MYTFNDLNTKPTAELCQMEMRSKVWSEADLWQPWTSDYTVL